MFFKKKPWKLDYEGTIAKPNGAILVVGIDDHKNDCYDRVKEVLAKQGCNWDAIGLDFPSYFYLKNGLVNVYGVIQLQTIKGMVGVLPPVRLDQEMVKNLTKLCESKQVPFLFIGDTYDPKLVTDKVRAILTLHGLRPVILVT